MTQTIFPIVDVETTGLDPNGCYLLEIAVILIDTEFQELGRFEQTVHYPPTIVADMKDGAVEFVQNMHNENGLWSEVSQPGPGAEDVDEMLADWLEIQIELFKSRGHQDEEIELRTIGNSLRLDLNFIESELPQTYGVLGYRSIDMSAVSKFLRIWDGHPDYEKKPTASHRAMADNEMCLAQLKHHVGILKGQAKQASLDSWTANPERMGQ